MPVYDDEKQAVGKLADHGQILRERIRVGRRNIPVHAGRDGFRSFFASRVVDPGNAGYSDLCVLPDKTILLLYGSGYFNNWFGLRGRCLRFNLEWLLEASS